MAVSNSLLAVDVSTPTKAGREALEELPLAV